MTTTYPTTKQTIPNPSSTDTLENSTPELDHDYQHSTVNDTIEALQDKVGVDGSAVTTSFDYKLSGVTGSDKAVSKTGTETLTNKTLTAPVINVGSDATGDMYYRNGSGVLNRLELGASGTIISSTGAAPEWIANPGTSDASTTVKGAVELATYAETIARTTTGGTGAKLVPTPDTLTTVLTYDYQADSVGTDSYAITCTPAPTAYTTGMRFTFKAGTANTGACSLNVNSLGAKTLKKNYNSDLSTGDILANQIMEVVYDGTNFQLVTPTAQPALYATGQTSRAGGSGTGTQNIAHGLGVTPKLIKISAVSFRSGGTMMTSTGTAKSTSTDTCVYSTNSGASGFGGSNNSAIIAAVISGPTTYVLADVSTLDSTNITLNFSTMDSLTDCYIQWEAFA